MSKFEAEMSGNCVHTLEVTVVVDDMLEGVIRLVERANMHVELADLNL
jgi:hypothetical protein